MGTELKPLWNRLERALASGSQDDVLRAVQLAFNVEALETRALIEQGIEMEENQEAIVKLGKVQDMEQQTAEMASALLKVPAADRENFWNHGWRLIAAIAEASLIAEREAALAEAARDRIVARLAMLLGHTG